MPQSVMIRCRVGGGSGRAAGSWHAWRLAAASTSA